MIFWKVDPVLLQIPIPFSSGALSIRWYGLCFAAAFLLGYLAVRRMYLAEGKSENGIDSLLMHLVIGTIVGARLGHCFLYEPDYYLANPFEILAVWHGGLASHGAAIGVLCSLFLFSRKYPDQPFLWVVDRVSVVVPLGGALVRLGNLFNSEIVGKETEVPWAFVFLRVDRVPRHPAQLYESICYMLIFITTISLFRRWRNQVKDGFFFGLFLVLVFGVRFFIEFFKEPQASFEAALVLNMGQLLSIPMILVGIGFLVVKGSDRNVRGSRERDLS